ncbi:hypothetical protein M378DRAFT_43210, partial [Amanita muscaria Koide BX008]
GVFKLAASTLIDAPIEDVWKVLLDFPSYNEWNAFVRNQTITDSNKTPLADQQTALPGHYINIFVHLPPTLSSPSFPSFLHSSSAFGRITTVDHTSHRAAWVLVSPLPKFLLTSERWQTLTVEEETGKTRYETVEVFGGVFAYFVKWLLQGALQQGFEAMAEGLKKRSE